jgi:hypothetical protein
VAVAVEEKAEVDVAATESTTHIWAQSKKQESLREKFRDLPTNVVREINANIANHENNANRASIENHESHENHVNLVTNVTTGNLGNTESNEMHASREILEIRESRETVQQGAALEVVVQVQLMVDDSMTISENALSSMEVSEDSTTEKKNLTKMLVKDVNTTIASQITTDKWARADSTTTTWKKTDR